jgi:hypothetical protein
MIERREILEMASRMSLRPNIVELGPQGPLDLQQAAGNPRPFVSRIPSTAKGWATRTASRRGASQGQPVQP